jgi:hypothetical protein
LDNLEINKVVGMPVWEASDYCLLRGYIIRPIYKDTVLPNTFENLSRINLHIDENNKVTGAKPG